MELKPGMKVILKTPVKDSYDYQMMDKYGLIKYIGKPVTVDRILAGFAQNVFITKEAPNLKIGVDYIVCIVNRPTCPICGGYGDYLFQLFLCENDKCQNGKGYMRQQQAEV